MSNLILLISDAYDRSIRANRNIRKEEVIDFLKENKCIFIISVIVVIISGMYALLWKSHWTVSLVYMIIAIPLMIIMNNQINRKLRANCLSHYQRYKVQLSVLKTVLSCDFNLYGKEKITMLISECDDIIGEFNFGKKVFTNLLKYIQFIFVPIISFVLGVMSKSVDSWLLAFQIGIFIVIVSGVLGILFLMIKNMVENYLNITSDKVKRLKGLLIDLYISEFTDI